MTTHKIYTRVGDTVQNMADSCVRLFRARPGLTEIEFEFNGLNVKATPKMTAGQICDQYSRLCDEACRRYRESPEGQAAAARNAQEVVEAQEKVDKMLAVLKGATATPRAMILWLMQFVDPADRTGVTYDKDHLVSTLVRAGFQEDEGVGRKNEGEDVARYIIGQVISMLRSDFKMIHPGAIKMWGQNYLDQNPSD